MDIIRILCDIRDIKIKNLINHFLRYLAVYIEEVYHFNNEETSSSLIDIYIISKNYSELSIDIKDEKKTILILTDGYDIDENNGIKKILYDNYSHKIDFLKALIEKIETILTVQKKIENRLIFDENFVGKITELYAKNNIFESSIMARYFFENRERFDWILNNYKNFVKELSCLYNESKSDLLNYAISYAMHLQLFL